MLSVRLNFELEKQLDFVSMKTGISKNQLMIDALQKFLKEQDLGSIPLEQQVQEAGFEIHRHNMNLQSDEGKKASTIADWAAKNTIWTAKPNFSGNPTGALYGRNLVVGFCWSADDKIVVISRWLSSPIPSGLDRCHFNITNYDDWIEHMQQLVIAK